MASAALVPEGSLGLSAFGGLAAFFGVWGIVRLTLLLREARPRTVWAAGFLLRVWGPGLFAPALDSYALHSFRLGRGSR